MPSGRTEWLSKALVERPAPEQPSWHLTSDKSQLEPGDIWVFAERPEDASSECRLMLVLDIEEQAERTRCQSVVAALISTDLDLASDRDVKLPSSRSGLPYPIMIETAFIGRVPWNNALRRVGVLDDSLVDAIVGFIWGDRGLDLDVLTGAPWPEPANDKRASFEIEELDVLRRLSDGSDPRFPTVDEEADPTTPGASPCVVADMSTARSLDPTQGGALDRVRSAAATHLVCEVHLHPFVHDGLTCAVLQTPRTVTESGAAPGSRITYADARSVVDGFANVLLQQPIIVSLYRDAVRCGRIALTPEANEIEGGLHVLTQLDRIGPEALGFTPAHGPALRLSGAEADAGMLWFNTADGRAIVMAAESSRLPPCAPGSPAVVADEGRRGTEA